LHGVYATFAIQLSAGDEPGHLALDRAGHGVFILITLGERACGVASPNKFAVFALGVGSTSRDPFSRRVVAQADAPASLGHR
jgi:hypothetical protein